METNQKSNMKQNLVRYLIVALVLLSLVAMAVPTLQMSGTDNYGEESSQVYTQQTSLKQCGFQNVYAQYVQSGSSGSLEESLNGIFILVDLLVLFCLVLGAVGAGMLLVKPSCNRVRLFSLISLILTPILTVIALFALSGNVDSIAPADAVYISVNFTVFGWIYLVAAAIIIVLLLVLLLKGKESASERAGAAPQPTPAYAQPKPAPAPQPTPVYAPQPTPTYAQPKPAPAPQPTPTYAQPKPAPAPQPTPAYAQPKPAPAPQPTPVYAPQPGPARTPQAVPDNKTEQTVFCARCGNKVPIQGRFCRYCGAPNGAVKE